MARMMHVLAGALLIAHGLGAEECEDNSIIFLQERLRMHENSKSLAAEVVGTTTGVIDGSEESCRDGECEYGDLLCEELLRYGRQRHGSQIALYNAGGIRASLPAGSVTREDVLAVHPFGNNATFFNLKGADLKQMLQDALTEHGAGPGKAGNWLQVAGLRFQASYDRTGWTLRNYLVKNAANGDWAELDNDTSYSIASNSYIMDGNGGRKVASDNLELIEANGTGIADLMIDFFKNNSPVSPPALDGRTYHEHSSKVFGTAAAYIDGSCRDHTCAYGSLICEEMLRQGQQAGYGTEVSLYHAGALLAGVLQGNVTFESLLQVHRFGYLISYFLLEGKHLITLLEEMLADHGAPGAGIAPGWLQMAGLRFKSSWNGTAWTLGAVEVKNGTMWKALNNTEMLTRNYSVAGSSYVRFTRTAVTTNAVPLKDDGPGALITMSKLFESSSPVEPPADDERECLTGNCTWPEVRDLSCRPQAALSMLIATMFMLLSVL